MSEHIDTGLPQGRSRPTPPGPRRRPPGRDTEQRRPSPVYRAALEMWLAKMTVLNNAREEGFTPS